MKCESLTDNSAQNYLQATSEQSLEVLEDHQHQVDQIDQEDPLKTPKHCG